MSRLLPYIIGVLILTFGDFIVARWIAQIQYWWQLEADKNFKVKCDQEYDRMIKNWDSFKKDRDV